MILSRRALSIQGLTAALLVLAVQHARSEDPRFRPSIRSWTQQNGLPTNEVTGLSRGRSGYLFIGTPSGVVRFDGLRFSPITHGQGKLQDERGISAFASIPGSDDVLAAPRTGGLLRLTGDGLSEQILPEQFAATPIEALFFENDITLWIGFKGGVAMRRQANRVEIFDTTLGLDPRAPVHFSRDGQGMVWLGSGGLLARYENGKLVGVPLDGAGQGGQLRIASSARNGPWVIVGANVCRFDQGRLIVVARLGEAAGAYYIQALLEDSSGVLWIGTRSRGLFRVTIHGEVSSVAQAPDDISALLEDTAGNLWIGAASNGILRIKEGVLTVFDRSAGLVENRSLAVCHGLEKDAWLANRDGGVFRRDKNGSWQPFEALRGWDDFSAYAVSPAKHHGVWASTSHGLLRLERDGVKTRHSPEFLTGSSAPRVVLTRSNGEIWFASVSGGLGRVREQVIDRYGTEHGLGRSVVRTMTEDAAGVLWIGCDDGTIFKLDEEEKFSPVDLQGTTAAVGAIQALHVDRTDTVWIGTQKGGVLRLQGGQIHEIDTKAGLISNNITHLVPDDHGVLWFGSPAGIFHIGLDELERFVEGSLPRLFPVVLGPDEGLQEATCSSEYQPSVWKAQDGGLWFATTQGVIAVDPARAHRAPERLRARITYLNSDGRLQKARPVHPIPAGTHTVELGYSAPNLSTPERVRLRYRLVGYEDAWTENTRNGTAKYTRLPPGTYRFEIAAVLAGVPGAESADSVTLHVLPAWWQTLWFRALISLAALVVLVLVVRHVSHRRLRQTLLRLERETALERERTRIAHNIHDELGAGLTRISLLTQSGHDRAKLQLDRIYDIVGDLIQSMDEIVWAVNPGNDDLENVASYLSEYAQSYLSDAGLRCRVQIPHGLPDHVLTAQFRHHLFLTCKEALHNVVKHARATDVSIQIEARDDTLIVSITDNGVGLPADLGETSHRNGLKTMRSRMQSLGGTLEIAAAADHGTVVTLVVTLPPRGAVP